MGVVKAHGDSNSRFRPAETDIRIHDGAGELEQVIFAGGSEAAVIDRRRVSVQWFSGTILTGLCGAALIGGAVFASLDGETNFATVPERTRRRFPKAADHDAL